MKRAIYTILMLFAVATVASAKVVYVSKSGKSTNHGTTWADAFDNVQQGIEAASEGDEVWVAAGTYQPTESTAGSGTNIMYLAFKMKAGVTVRGGFAGTETDKDQRAKTGNLTGKVYVNETILSGNLTNSMARFRWDPVKGHYKTSFYGNCYHVVWFAVNGFDGNNRAKALTTAATLEGFTITGGHANNADITQRSHNAYGGGVYMVANSYVQNCYIYNCDASRNGGGVYMDGGGEVRHTVITECQALGVGIDHGFGGGLCAEGNGTTNSAVFSQSMINNCVGRKGGGLAFLPTTGYELKLAANASVINNNTALTEGGGVYTENGGALANLTIVRNNCSGSGVSASGVESGRTGGLYCLDKGGVANCVIWGNECSNSQSKLQYVGITSAYNSALKSRSYYNAMSSANLIDWSGSLRMGITALSEHNDKAAADAANAMEDAGLGFPLFTRPTPTAGYIENLAALDYDWSIAPQSALRHAGIITADLEPASLAPEPGANPDITDRNYSSHSTLGAYSVQGITITVPERPTGEYHFFVDPQYVFKGDEKNANCSSWDNPGRFLANVLEEIKTNNSKYAGKKVVIHVKEGEMKNINSNYYGHVRMTSFNIPSNVTILGGYPTTLRGTDTSLRNPIAYPSILTGNILAGQPECNVAHLITIDNKQNITIDGLQLRYANAATAYFGNTGKLNGAAITITGSTTGIEFKNIVVSNCQAVSGAVVYASGSTASFENCIFHNNTAAKLDVHGDYEAINKDDSADAIYSLIYGVNGSNLTFNHCNTLRSVGYASYLDATTRNTWNNSMFYGNLDRRQDNTNNCATYALIAFSGAGANSTKLSGDHNMFDTKTFNAGNKTAFGSIVADVPGADAYNTNGLNYTYKSGTANGYPRMINPTKNAGVSWDGDVTYYGRATSFEPHNDNPVVNTASYSGDHTTWGKDITAVITRDFGGLPDIGAVESHVPTKDEVINENSNPDGQHPYGGVFYVRDYTSTGTPMKTYNSDHSVNTDGLGIYNAAGELLDGTSWYKAINGNATYTLSGKRTYKDIQEKDVMGFRLHVGNMYLDVANSTLNRVDCTPGISSVADPGTDPDPEAHEYKPEDCVVFVLCGTDGKELALGSTINGTRRLKIASTGEYLYLDYTNNTYTFRTSLTPPSSQANATITASGGNYTIRYTANKQNRYIFNGSTIPSSASTAWTFTQISGFKIQEGSGTLHENEDYNLGDFNGLQYAVNKANLNFGDEYSLTGDLTGSRKMVWVGAGVYASDPKVRTTPLSGTKSEADPEAENCYIIQDGVDVYGAFPKTGDPGMDQREALVSQYVHVLTERGIANPLDYETILEPKTKTVTVDVTRRVLGQTWDYNPKKTGYKIFYGAKWDGFTLRDGVLDAAKITYPNRHGGAGAAIYNNVTLKNVVVTGNTTIYKSASSQQDFRAGGVYMDGGTLDAGYVINNKLESYTASDRTKTSGAAYGGGMYIYRGTVFNSVVSRNSIYANYADGAGTFIEDANFFNNTIVYNKAEGTSRMCGGVAIWNDAASRGTDSELNVYNCIIAKNEGGLGGKTGNENMRIQSGGVMNINYCITEDAHSTYVSGSNKITFSNCKEVSDYRTVFVTDGTIDGDFKNFNLRINSGASNASKAINAGNGAPVIHGAVYNLTDYNDMDFDDRIQDCRIDIGAYEYNGATGIRPQKIAAAGDNAAQAIYYVTPEGYGTTEAYDPENAACAQKLQRVIDAAGRYKFENPNTQVIVKVANSYDMLHSDDPDNFHYYACRTTDQSSTDTRMWSIIIPRGVEVWGGYTDVAPSDNTKTSWTNDNNGFETRDILGNPTYFESYFYNRDSKINAISYHVVTFTDRVYDSYGKPYMSGDVTAGTLNPSSSYDGGIHEESEFLHMKDAICSVVNPNRNVQAGVKVDGRVISSRGVLDGIFVSGGMADGKAIAGSSYMNVNGCGGAAIVNEYAHVRNCIVTGNQANYGGGFAVTQKGIVSGTLIMQNEAEYGGGLYIFEDETTLSDGTVIDTKQGSGSTMDWNMPHIFTSTVVDNTANQQGGGLWFTSSDNPNVRVMSSVFWNNHSGDQPNVAGNINPEKANFDSYSTNEFYPLGYSAVQDIRVAGANNLNVSPNNINGVRFVQPADDMTTYGKGTAKNWAIIQTNDAASGFGYYGLTNYSILNRTGMPVQFYTSMQNNTMALSPTDISGRSWLGNESIMPRRYVEIGARALDKVYPQKEMMLRLFVAQPEDVDMDAAQAMMSLAPNQDPVSGSYDDYTDKNYYSQEGSSFAYPMQSLQDALDYVQSLRSNERRTGDSQTLVDKFHGNNLPFEIFVAKGVYYPTRSVWDNYTRSYSNTFVIPEGVTIVGGFNSQGGCTESAGGKTYSYYGRYYKRDETALNTFSGAGVDHGYINNNVTEHHVDKDKYNTFTGENGKVINLQEWSATDIENRRALADNNGNSIIEPWEFKNQTILSGNTTNVGDDGVYHVITAVADQNVAGMLPKRSKADNANYDPSDPDGYLYREEGQMIHLNGLVISGGAAYAYEPGAMDAHGDYTFYQGGGIFVEGNRYCDGYNNRLAPGQTEAEKNQTFYPKVHQQVYAVGYRDIPLSVSHCQFLNNKGGYGGAISSNGTLDIFASSFEKNLAIYTNDTGEYPAGHAKYGQTYTVQYPGEGGAILATHQLLAVNTIFANNEAQASTYNVEPQYHVSFRVPVNTMVAVPQGAGGAIFMGSAGVFHTINCDFVRNKANMYPAVMTMNPTFEPVDKVNVTTHEYSQMVNTVAWGNEVNENMLSNPSVNDVFLFAAKMMVNVGKKDRSGDYIPRPLNTFKLFDEAGDNTPKNQASLDDDDWQEAVWFSAYEEGVGFTPHNENDFREIDYKPFGFIPKQLSEYDPAGGALYYPYQNCNILLSSENSSLEGPNFGNPSYKAGIDGYMENADWSPARINNLTDNGSGMINQRCEPQTYACSYPVYASKGEVPAGRDAYSSEGIGDYKTTGAYTVTHYLKTTPEYKLGMAVGTEKYMFSATVDDTDPTNLTGKMPLPRISFYPEPAVDKAYIDIGVYEYQHTSLRPKGDEVDVLWVSTQEHPENGIADGLTWSTPTSDLQRAIETLLSSRNGHKKEIRIMEGEYSPVRTYTDNTTTYQTFYIDTKALNANAFMPLGEGGTPKYDEGVQSLTIKGGYSKDLEFLYDVEKFPVVLRQQNPVKAGTSVDHLFYISDATQRYGKSEYNAGNEYGALKDVHDTKHTFPIHIDGVMLVNDNSNLTANVEGSVLKYNNQVSGVTGTTPATITTKITYYNTEELRPGDESDVPTDYFKIDEYVDITNPAKLIMSKCIVAGSGKAGDSTGSAVYTGQYGGNVLLYNNVFHSNRAYPLKAYNATTINNTFALNGKEIQLYNQDYSDDSDIPSRIFNSAMWRNNPTSGYETNPSDVNVASSYGDQFTIESGGSAVALSAANYAYNSHTGGPETEDSDKNNVLSNTNADVGGGPEFKDPYEKSVLSRSFKLNASDKLVNKGSDALYKDNVDISPLNVDIYDLAIVTSTNLDAAGQTRIIPSAIERGAYEYLKDFIRIIYVNPNSPVNGNGTSWPNAMGYGNIQNAIDLASLYTTNNKKEAFVFVKGTLSDENTGETLVMRNGVRVYGSLPPHFNKECDPLHEDYSDEARIADYEKVVKTNRDGIASPNRGTTIVSGIKTMEATQFTADSPASEHTDEHDYEISSVIDGFDVTAVTNSNPSGTITEPIVNVNPNTPAPGAKLVLTNLIVHDTDASGADVNTAEVDNALIYEVLMRDNKVKDNKAVFKLGKNAYAVNVTVEGKTTYVNNSSVETVAPYNGNYAVSAGAYVDDCRIWNSIVNYDEKTTLHEDTKNTLSGYNYYVIDRNLNYQLAEKSKHIDECDQALALYNPQVFLPANLRPFVNYDIDQDILGNPRLLTGVTQASKIDRGAFETWKVENNGKVFVCGNAGTIASAPGYSDAAHADIKKHFFPHDGSVVYIMEGQTLVIDPVDDQDVNETAHNPCYMLLKEGANFYGNGRAATCAFVAVERYVKAGGDIVSMPFPMRYLSNGEDKLSGTNIPTYDANGILTLGNVNNAEWTYNGKTRSDWRYKIQDAESPCWDEVTDVATVTEANKGVRIDPMQGAMLIRTLTNEGYKYLKLNAGKTDLEVTSNIDEADRWIVGNGRQPGSKTLSVDNTYFIGLKKGTSFIYTGGEYEDLNIAPYEGGYLIQAMEGASKGDRYLYLNGSTVESNTSKMTAWTICNIFRFTGRRSMDMQDFVYTEAQAEHFKTVELKQNDDRQSTEGAADFTTKENMGWNLIGLPYLVSDYKPYEKTQAGYYHDVDGREMLFVPHELWLYYDGTQTPDGQPSAMNGAGYYPVNSWENTDDAWHVSSEAERTIWVGEGIFTQTATLNDTETLKFYLPVYKAPVSPTKGFGRRIYITDGIEDIQTPSESRTAGKVMKVSVTGGMLSLDADHNVRPTEDSPVTVYDVHGRKIDTLTSERTLSLPNGVYIVVPN